MRHVLRSLLGLAWLLGLMFAAEASAQSIMERLITPGPLSAAHAKLESQCGVCHSSFRKEDQNGKCVACHKTVASDISAGSGFHGKYTPARTGACKSCHSDHQGRAYALVRLDRSNFNHALTDYSLTGAHAKVACAGCHAAGKKFRDASSECAACHGAKDPHRGQLGRACQTCHVTTAWKPILAFDHGRTGFALTGAHRQATCISCHTGQRWKGLGSSCIACHAKDDTHKGSRGTNCASCHTTTNWKSSTFDHATTGFPLIGGHAIATCAGCHGQGNSIKRPSQTCFACHAKDDTHKGQNGNDCASCHTARNWRQISFDHDKLTKFPLKGAHRAATCQSCHKQAPKLASPPVTCFGCHAKDDTHKGGNGMDCGRCHNEGAWKSVQFDHTKMTRFPLIGKHAQVKCEICHTKPPEELKLSMECASCHTADDIHRGKLGPACGRCHNSNDWKTGIRFDHDLSRFPLLGKHAQLQCVSCHADKTFASKGVACASCHEDKHHKGTLGSPAECRTCHNSNDWKSWTFDHDRQTSFTLTGKHKGLICSACHVRAGDPAKQDGRCIACHRRNDVHRGGFGEDCERCHVTSSFAEIIMPGKN